MTEEEIIKKICLIGDAMDFDVSEHLPKIAKIKSRLVDWRICPCDRANVHRYCGSRQCEMDVEEYGHCHCNLYLKRKTND